MRNRVNSLENKMETRLDRIESLLEALLEKKEKTPVEVMDQLSRADN